MPEVKYLAAEFSLFVNIIFYAKYNTSMGDNIDTD